MYLLKTELADTRQDLAETPPDDGELAHVANAWRGHAQEYADQLSNVIRVLESYTGGPALDGTFEPEPGPKPSGKKGER